MSRIYTINYDETTYTIQGDPNKTKVEMTTRDVNKLLNTVKVACCGHSIKDRIVVDIEEVM